MMPKDKSDGKIRRTRLGRGGGQAGPGGPGVAPLCSGHYFLPAAGYVNVSGSLASSSFELAAKQTGLLFSHVLWSDFFASTFFCDRFFKKIKCEAFGSS